MRGIPDHIYVSLRETLIECGPFDSNEHLRAIFASNLLFPWRNRLPEESNAMDRVDALISFLVDKYHAGTGRNALEIFVSILKDRTDPQDICYQHLENLLQQLNTLFASSSQPRKASAIPNTTPHPTRTSAFISYSQNDKKYLDELQVHLALYIRAGRLDVWDDTRILPGSKWREEISKALQTTKVAILLVSAQFLASDFIATHVLPPLLAAAENEGAIIIPVILRASAFQSTEIAQFQAVNPLSLPVAPMSRAKRDEVWSRVALLVRDALDTDH